MCLRQIHSFSVPFRSGFSYLKTSTTLHFHSMHPPQHPAAAGILFSFHRLHSIRIPTAHFPRLPAVCFNSLRRVHPIRKDHWFSPPPISCAGNKTLVFIVSVCFRSMHSIPSPFRSGFSYLKTCTPFCFHSIHSPQHRTRSGKTPSFRRLHLFRFTPSLIQPFQRYVSFPAAYSPRNIILVWLIQLSEKKYHLFERKKEEEKESGSAMKK